MISNRTGNLSFIYASRRARTGGKGARQLKWLKRNKTCGILRRSAFRLPRTHKGSTVDTTGAALRLDSIVKLHTKTGLL
jgi:hypothetical protein